jgi:hypothetical protein
VLDGARGAPPADLDALANAISKLSIFAAENSDTIQTIDINPFLALPKGALAVDALIIPSSAS